MKTEEMKEINQKRKDFVFRIKKLTNHAKKQ